MRHHPDLPQGIPTLALAMPGQRVVVRAVLRCDRCPHRELAVSPGEALRCISSTATEMEFDKANGSRIRIDRPWAEHIQIERGDLDAEESMIAHAAASRS